MRLQALFRKFDAGYTLIEMTVVGAIVIVGSVVTIPVTMRMVQNAKGDSALEMTSTFLQSARNRAVAERRNFLVTFVSDTRIQVDRIEVPDGTLTFVDQLTLEGDNEFLNLPEVPEIPGDFGGADAVNFSGIGPVMFTSDGSLIDAAGDVTNATIFVARPNSPETARAVTIWGVTGLVRPWKWRGSVWEQ